MNEHAKKSAGSGEHPIVVEFRRKMESIAEHTAPELEALHEKIDRIARSSRPPKRDPRREDDDTDPAIPIDVVRFVDDDDTDPDEEKTKP